VGRGKAGGATHMATFSPGFRPEPEAS